MLNSKSNNTKLIMETWRRFLNEDPSEEVDLHNALKDIASTINIESIAESDSIFDQMSDHMKVALMLTCLTIIAAGAAIPKALKEMDKRHKIMANVEEFVKQIENGDIECTQETLKKARKLAKDNAVTYTLKSTGGKPKTYFLSGPQAQAKLKNIGQYCPDISN